MSSRTTRRLEVHPSQLDRARLEEAAEVLRGGGLVAFATETVYGLGALALSTDAVARIFEAKGRPSTNPLIVHVDNDPGMIAEVVADFPRVAQLLASAFWPGPLTLVLRRSKQVPDLTTAGQPTVGLRVPNHPVALGLIKTLGAPIAAPSANRSNRISPTTADHVEKDLLGRIDLILDSGPTTVGLESTVLDLTSERPRILRPGMIGVEAIERVMGCPVETFQASIDDREARSSPGLLKTHYAPTTPTVRIEPGESIRDLPGRWALVCFDTDRASETKPNEIVCLPNPVVAATRLYDVLHTLDDANFDRIVIEMPSDRPEWHAIRDRLTRAARPIS